MKKKKGKKGVVKENKKESKKDLEEKEEEGKEFETKENKEDVKRGLREEKKEEGEILKEDKDISIKEAEKIKSIEFKQTVWVLIAIALLFLLFLTPYFYTQRQKNFEFAGVNWQVEKHGDLTLYRTQFAKTYMDTYYGEHNTYLRNDPRKNDVEVDVGNLSFFRTLIISSSPEVSECYGQVIATDSLYQISLAMPFLRERIIALSDEDVAEEYNMDYFDCFNKPDKSTLIQVQMGNESKITHDKENKCYFITISDCEENLVVVERFIIEVIRQLNKDN